MQDEYTNPLGISHETLVTPETFAGWLVRFNAEADALKAKDGVVVVVDTEKHTGKQLFQLNLAKSLEETGAETKGESKEAADEVFWFNESVYDDDDVELSTDDEEEETEKSQGKGGKGSSKS